MRAGLGLQSTTAIAAACLMFSTWVVGCTGAPEAAPPSSSGAVSAEPGPGAGPSRSQSPDTPVSNSISPTGSPTAQSTPPASPPPTADPGKTGTAAPSTPGSSPGSGGAAPGSGDSGAGSVGSAPALPSQGAGSPPNAGTAVEPSPGTSGSPPTSDTARAAVVPPQMELGPAVYYVAINDGGSRGVRFGCNDSLVPIRGPASSGDPLTVALGRLLGAGLPVDNDAALYDSLAASSLHFVSGYVSGSTVVVNLGGSIRPGGVCDIPRIEAQLTHTVVAASGASRAEIYVNGMTLEVALSLR